MVLRTLKLEKHPINLEEPLLPTQAPAVNTAISETVRTGVTGKKMNVTTNTAAQNAAKKIIRSINAMTEIMNPLIGLTT